MLPLLANLVAVVTMYVVYGIVRGLGKEKIFVILLMIFYIGSVFVVLFMILIGVGQNSLSFAMLLSEGCITIGGILIIGLADWRKEADVIVNKSE